MFDNTVEDYKKAIKEKYDQEKYRNNSDSLLNPSRAKLRDLCIELISCNTNPDDLKVFASFLNFEFNPTLRHKLNTETDKFRPIENFFRGKSNPANIKTLNMAAILIDFQPRPYLKFSKTNFIAKSYDYNEEFIPTVPTTNKKKNKNLRFLLIFSIGTLAIKYSFRLTSFKYKFRK